MKSLFYQGGAVFMGILTLLLLAVVVWNVYHFIVFSKSNKETLPVVLRKFGYGKSIGIFSLVTGILGQMIGLFSAFSYLQDVSDVSPAILFAGIKVSMITTLYGMSIFLLSLLIWFVMTTLVERKM